MEELYDLTIEQGKEVCHGRYSLHHYHKAIGLYMTAFDVGVIRLIVSECPVNSADTTVSVYFGDGQISKWKTKWISPYIFQFGIAASHDGKYIFFQTWENGLLCVDAHTGEIIWQTKSRRGITNIFINENTLVIHQHERALQLLNVRTGEIIKEKRPATAWGFTAIDHKHIVCQVTARRWEIIDTETLETKMIFSHREFTGGHENYCINHIELDGQKLIVRGFRNMWDDTINPAKKLPNLQFEHRLLLSEKAVLL